MHQLNDESHIHRVFFIGAFEIVSGALRTIADADRVVPPSTPVEVAEMARTALGELQEFELRYGLLDGFPNMDRLSVQLERGEL